MSLGKIMPAGKAVSFQYLGDPTIETLDHAMGCRMSVQFRYVAPQPAIDHGPGRVPMQAEHLADLLKRCDPGQSLGSTRPSPGSSDAIRPADPVPPEYT